MSLWKRYALKHPELKVKLKKARMNVSPEDYVKKGFITAVMSAVTVWLVVFFAMINKPGGNTFWKCLGISLGFGILAYIFMFWISMRSVDVKIRERAREIDREILFAGRFLIVKLSSGRPLINTLMDASRSYGVGAKFFREIMRDIELGSSVERALDRAMEYSPSDKFKKVLFQINNALRIGIDVTRFLTATLEEISHEQIEEIKRYGKKLNSVILFYLLFGIVIPSLGVSLIAILGTFTGLEVNKTFFIVLLLFVIITQSAFMIAFRAIRPQVNV
ncbi:type II secretion system F family protein [Candidatus Woesearchaeota archaeon]|nr:type II secretion system F family protein [Candidatus Woesearchaeota archaeon]